MLAESLQLASFRRSEQAQCAPEGHQQLPEVLCSANPSGSGRTSYALPSQGRISTPNAISRNLTGETFLLATPLARELTI